MSRFFQSDFPETSICIKPDKIDLNDCLACSGCITSTEKDRFMIDTSFLDDRTRTYSFILSSQSKMNISRFYPKVDYSTFERALVGFLKKEFSIHIVVDTSYFRKPNESGISSECPAVVLYVERVFPSLLEHLSKVKTYQQIAAEWIRSKSVEIENHRIVAVMQCYDKKDELHRDNTGIDHFLGTANFYEFLKDRFVLEEHVEADINTWEMSHKQDISEISGMEACINSLNRAKTNGVSEFLELRICKNGCINGPAQLRVDKETLTNCHNIDGNASILFAAGQRIFQKPKRKTFDIEW